MWYGVTAVTGSELLLDNKLTLLMNHGQGEMHCLSPVTLNAHSKERRKSAARDLAIFKWLSKHTQAGHVGDAFAIAQAGINLEKHDAN